MEHLALEIFDKTGTDSKFAALPSNTRIHVRRTSQIFGKGNVWTHEFSINIPANAHIFGTAGELHGARLHEQIDKRRARLWVEGLPLYYGYLRLANEVDVDEDGNVDVSFESGHKTFEDMLDGKGARDVSVGDVMIGVALNRKRGVMHDAIDVRSQLDAQIKQVSPEFGDYLSQLDIREALPANYSLVGICDNYGRTQRWPKLVLAQGMVNWHISRYPVVRKDEYVDTTNIQTPYDDAHPYCNVNICYQKKYTDAQSESSEDKTARGYIVRLAHGKDTELGGDNETRYNNAPNFYLLHWLKRLFIDLGIYIEENQMLAVEDLRRVYLANVGCFYEEKDNGTDPEENYEPGSADWQKYGYCTFPTDIFPTKAKFYPGDDDRGSILARNITIRSRGGAVLDRISSAPGSVLSIQRAPTGGVPLWPDFVFATALNGYRAYATSENYPDVDAQDIITAVESAFGVRFLFDSDFQRVRVVLLRNIFRNKSAQDLGADVISISKQENSIRGFRMTYGGSDDDTNFNYKDWSNLETDKSYDEIKLNYVTAFNKKCYLLPNTGNTYRIKIDEDELVLFPTLHEVAGYCDAEDGDCAEEESTTEVSVNAVPQIMNEVDGSYAVFFDGDMKAPGKMEVAAQAAIDTTHVTYEAYSEHQQDYVQVDMDLDYYLKEGYIADLQDNYQVDKDGQTPFDKADLGLRFGIMRSSGSDARVSYQEDTIGGEGNDWWEVVPGSGAIDHPDTCNNYGDLWDYNGSDTDIVNTAAKAVAKLAESFPSSNAPFNATGRGYINGAGIFYLYDTDGKRHSALLVTSYSTSGATMYPLDYVTYPEYLSSHSVEEMRTLDAAGHGALRNLLVEIDSSQERCNTLLDLCKMAYGGASGSIPMDNGVGSLYGRFSLKLRAEKPNPYFDSTQPESDNNRRYLEITDPNLQGRGLADQFYKEYSYWVRNARIANIEKELGIAQLSTLDDTVRVHVGDVTGFIQGMEFDVDIQTGLGPVVMKVMYI